MLVDYVLSLFERLLPGYGSLGIWVCGMDMPHVRPAPKGDISLLSMAQPGSTVCHFRLNKPDSEKSLMLVGHLYPDLSDQGRAEHEATALQVGAGLLLQG